jgi:Protein of unknown function (DUF2750)
MSQASSQAWAFYREVAATGVVWTIRDNDGFPAPVTSSGKRAQPFWSSRSRVERIIASVPAYSAFEPYEVSWEDFCNKWVPGLTRDGCLVGVNWSGKRALGYDLEPRRVAECVQALIDTPQ